jgi:hypothetical protein
MQKKTRSFVNVMSENSNNYDNDICLSFYLVYLFYAFVAVVTLVGPVTLVIAPVFEQGGVRGERLWTRLTL